MKKHILFTLIASVSFIACSQVLAAGHEIIHPGDRASAVGSSKIFTGQVRQDSVARADENSPYGVTYVTFEPGARTYWHSHPAGQRLLVVFGKGLVGTADGVTEVVRAGDFVWCPPNVVHWHGASPDTAMTHIAFTNVKNGKSVEWKNELTDQEYQRFASTAKDSLK